ncbi:hypothetical protein HBB16_13745 [Pseudonocardia sp. MCCB 268]|nr:hypothetical protein [Pseudonocardia cytotoxica]
MSTAVALARHVRRRRAARGLRQDRPRSGDGAPVRPIRRCCSPRPVRDDLSAAEQQKAAVRQRVRRGRDRPRGVLEAESQSYHGPDLARSSGTANSNQLPSWRSAARTRRARPSSTWHPAADALTAETACRALVMAGDPAWRWARSSTKAVLNGIVALLATGVPTNHTMHLVAMDAAAGVEITYDLLRPVGESSCSRDLPGTAVPT